MSDNPKWQRFELTDGTEVVLDRHRVDRVTTDGGCRVWYYCLNGDLVAYAVKKDLISVFCLLGEHDERRVRAAVAADRKTECSDTKEEKHTWSIGEHR